jgi:hypothetical protein
MRINIYNEELTNRVVIKRKKAEGTKYVGIRFFLELPVTVDGKQHQGPFMHKAGDDDSSAVTFWATDKKRLRKMLQKAIDKLG